MATGGFSMPIQGPSCGGVLDVQCGICKKKGKCIEAKTFCNECEGYLCSLCTDKHMRFPALRNHKTTPIEKMKKICEICKADSISKNAICFCKDCNSWICDDCKESHENFKDLQKHTLVSKKDMFYLDSKIDILRYKAIKKIKEVAIRISGERQPCRITDCCFMPGGELVLCDFGFNSKFKLFGRSLALVESLEIYGHPWAVAAVDNSNVIVTKPDEYQLQFVQVLPSLKKGRTIDVDQACYGVAVAAGKIFVSCSNYEYKVGDIRMYDIEGRDLGKKLGLNPDGSNIFRCPGYVAVSRSGDKIFVSDNGSKSLCCLTLSDEKKVYQYQLNPRGLYVDDNDNAIVCEKDTIQVITIAGKSHKTLLSPSSRNGPQCVSFRPSDGILVVGGLESDKLMVYKMS